MFGIEFVTTAIFKIACDEISVVIPIATKLPNKSGAFNEIIIPLIVNKANNIITKAQPTNPNSSAKIAKIKSLCASGIYKYFWVLFPNPTPNNPPEPIAIRPWLVW